MHCDWHIAASHVARAFALPHEFEEFSQLAERVGPSVAQTLGLSTPAAISMTALHGPSPYPVHDVHGPPLQKQQVLTHSFSRPQLATAMAKGSASTAVDSEAQLATRQAEHVGLAWLSAHAPDWHESPVEQTKAEPQPPQLSLSVRSLTHAPLHRVNPLLHVKVHLLATHAGAALAMLVVHAFPQRLQWSTSLAKSTQEAPQSIDGAAHSGLHAYESPDGEHTPASCGQTLPQLPQLDVLEYSTQAPSQRLEPAAHTTAHVPSTHVSATPSASDPASSGSVAASSIETVASACGAGPLSSEGPRSSLASVPPGPAWYASSPETVAHAPSRTAANMERFRECVTHPSDFSRSARTTADRIHPSYF
jgi:hypothetical protein